jgi:hypothetical protein
MAWFHRKARTARPQTARARATKFTPSLEQLEIRAVPAVSVSLAAGLLTVNGTSGNDSIVLRQSSGRVSISGVTNTFATTSINSVVINDGGGNDSVSLSGLKAQPWSKPITVNSSGGDESVKVLDGRTCYLNGSNARLQISGPGAVTLNGRSPDWFDYSVHDAALRQLSQMAGLGAEEELFCDFTDGRPASDQKRDNLHAPVEIAKACGRKHRASGEN